MGLCKALLYHATGVWMSSAAEEIVAEVGQGCLVGIKPDEPYIGCYRELRVKKLINDDDGKRDDNVVAAELDKAVG